MENNEKLPFSQRYGHKPINPPFQIEEINDTLRVEIWNAVYMYIIQALERADRYSKDDYRSMHEALWIHFFKMPLDDFPDYDFHFDKFIREFIEKADWYDVYDLLEDILIRIDGKNMYQVDKFKKYLKYILKNNYSGYQLVDLKFVPVTSETEIKEIEDTISLSTKYNLHGIHKHLTAAVHLISKKPTPDYRNSIKESISMVEVIARIIEPGANTLGKALKKLEHNKRIPQVLKDGFEKLYAYSNSKDGIRHAIMSESSLDIEDARFFLVSCSAFTNYLIEKANKEGLLNND